MFGSGSALAASFFGSFSLLTTTGGIVVGLVLAVTGLALAVRLGDEERIAAAMADDGE